jgi:hypothetical protein
LQVGQSLRHPCNHHTGTVGSLRLGTSSTRQKSRKGSWPVERSLSTTPVHFGWDATGSTNLSLELTSSQDRVMPLSIAPPTTSSVLLV